MPRTRCQEFNGDYFLGLAASCVAGAEAAGEVAAPAAACSGVAAAFSFFTRILKCLTFGRPRTECSRGLNAPFP